MDVTIRLYKLHDFDLVYLYKTLKYPIKEAMKESLTAYVNAAPVSFSFPVKAIPEEDVIVRNSQFHIFLDEKENKKEIEFLKGIRDRYRNSFLKNLLRYYLYGPAVFPYEKEADIELAKESVLSMIGGEKEIRKVSKTRRSKKI